MLNKIYQHIQQTIAAFETKDTLILNNKNYPLDQNRYQPIYQHPEPKAITFIDGGQAEIALAGNFCLSLVMVAAVTLKNDKKLLQQIQQFYVFTKAVYNHNNCNNNDNNNDNNDCNNYPRNDHEICYESKIFTEKEPLIDELDLFISSMDQTIKAGLERAPIQKIASMARRFAELALASKINADFIILDGTLEKTFKNEEKYLPNLPHQTSAIAKTSSLFTTSGNSPAVLLNKISPPGNWVYPVTEKTSFIKLHPAAKHVFRFEGNKEVLPYLPELSKDALFLGYPYGLILADKLARISHQEQKSLSLQLLLKSDSQMISQYLQNANAHEILDTIG